MADTFPKTADTSPNNEVESLARDLNRHLTDLLGPCPIRRSSSWVEVSVNSEGVTSIEFPLGETRDAEALLRAVRQACEAKGSHDTHVAARYNPNGVGIEFREEQRSSFHVSTVHP